jgi:protein-S-isoprenylcysteine O-methyltransferase Ste14
MYLDILYTILSWGIYFFLHSYLASVACKDWVDKHMPRLNYRYRMIYNGVSIVGLIPILYFLASTSSVFLFEKTTTLKYIALMLATWGIILVKTAFKTYNIREFIGTNKNESKSEFVKTGLLKYMRHPIYTGTILIIIGFWLFIPSILNLTTVLCVFIYLVFGIRLEEEKLINEFGEEYENFQQEVPMLFPSIMSLFKKSKG